MILLLQSPNMRITDVCYYILLIFFTFLLMLLYLSLILLVFLLLIVSLMNVKWYGSNFHFVNELVFEHFCVLLDHLHEQKSIQILYPFYFIYVSMTPPYQQPLAFSHTSGSPALEWNYQ